MQRRKLVKVQLDGLWKKLTRRFSAEKPTRRFFVGKADTLIFRWKSRHVDFSLKKRTRRA